jgi:hypothetical protein
VLVNLIVLGQCSETLYNIRASGFFVAQLDNVALRHTHAVKDVDDIFGVRDTACQVADVGELIIVNTNDEREDFRA